MESERKTILVVGTFDTKNDELNYLANCILSQSGQVLTMDVSVLGDSSTICNISKHNVASAANSSIQQVIESGDENSAMQIMAKGSAKIVFNLYKEGKIKPEI